MTLTADDLASIRRIVREEVAAHDASRDRRRLEAMGVRFPDHKEDQPS